MKKYLLALLSVASIAGYASANTLYHTTFDSAEEIQGWSVIDANNDESCWGYSESGDPGKRFYYNYNYSNQADDWAISPAITPTESGKFLVKYNFTGSAYSEAMKVYYGSAATIDALSANLVGDYPSIDSSEHGGYFVVNAEAGQPFYIGFYACSDADRWRLYLNSLTVSSLTSDPADIALSAITAPVTGENLGKEAVKILVKNVGEAEISGFTATYSIDGGAAVSEEVSHTIAAGDEYEYTFSTLADLSEPYKLYTISASVSNDADIDESNNSASTTVRHYADQVEPYTMGFEASEDTSRIQYFNLNEDSGDWEVYAGSWYMNLARTGNYCLAYNYDSDNNADDWAILEPIKVSAGYHALKFWYSGGDNHTEKLRVAYGTSPNPEAMTNVIVDLPEITKGEYQESVNIFSIDNDATIYIGFYAYSDKDENWLTIDDITLDSFDPTSADISLSNFSSLSEYVPLADYKRVTFDLYNMSLNTAAVKVNVAVDGQVVATNNETVLAQQTRTITYEGLLDNVAEGNHTITVTSECDADTNADNNSVSITTRFLGTPDILYDFEDGKVPETFDYFANDGGTLNSSAVEEFGENGWYATPIENHQLYGNYMLAGTTWIDFPEDSYDTTVDRILVLPQVKVTDDDACFVWNAGTFYDEYPVSYRIMANNGYWGDTSNKWHYDYLKSFPNQGTTRSNQGVSLSDYKGQNIYVAIHLYGESSDAIVFDNLQFHGCKDLSSAVANISTDNAIAIKVVGDQLNILANDAIKAVNVFDVNGRIVASGNSSSISLSSLPKGVYVVKAATVGSTKTVKIVK